MGEDQVSAIFTKLEAIEKDHNEHATRFFRRLDAQDDSISTIKTALIGNEEFKQPGLVDRVEKLEIGHVEQGDKIESNARAVAIGSGSVGLIGVVMAVIKFFK